MYLFLGSKYELLSRFDSCRSYYIYILSKLIEISTNSLVNHVVSTYETHLYC